MAAWSPTTSGRNVFLYSDVGLTLPAGWAVATGVGIDFIRFGSGKLGVEVQHRWTMFRGEPSWRGLGAFVRWVH